LDFNDISNLTANLIT